MIFCVRRNGTRSGVSRVFPYTDVLFQAATEIGRQTNLLEETIKVNMYNIPSIGIQQDVLTMPVS